MPLPHSTGTEALQHPAKRPVSPVPCPQWLKYQCAREALNYSASDTNLLGRFPTRTSDTTVDRFYTGQGNEWSSSHATQCQGPLPPAPCSLTHCMMQVTSRTTLLPPILRLEPPGSFVQGEKMYHGGPRRHATLPGAFLPVPLPVMHLTLFSRHLGFNYNFSRHL